MRILRDVAEAEVVALFLKTEISSNRFGKPIVMRLQHDGKPDLLITQPDLTNTADNAYRLDVLGEVRGFGRNAELFDGFPSDVHWKQVLLEKSDLEQAMYIDYDYWVGLSDGSRRVRDGAKNIEAGKVVFDVPNNNFWSAAEAIIQGKEFPQMIFVAKDEQSRLVVLEGHLRLTAYFLADRLPANMTAITGFHPSMPEWGSY